MTGDFTLDDDGDLKISNGDFEISDATEQNILSILATSPGDYKQFPFVGIAYVQNLHSNDDESLVINLKKQLEVDGMKIKKVSIIKEGGFEVDGKY